MRSQIRVLSSGHTVMNLNGLKVALDLTIFLLFKLQVV